jgi:Tfp pilus assembly protein PilO
MIKNIVIAVLALGFIGVIILLDIPLVQNILDTRKEIKTQQEEFSQKVEFIETVKQLSKKYKGNESIFNQLDFILPDDDDVPNLIVQIEAIANDSGVTLEDFSISEIEDSEEKKLDYGVASVDLKMNSSYEAFKGFLSSLENSMRLMDIDSISFSQQSDEEENSASFDFSLIFKVYYQIN